MLDLDLYSDDLGRNGARAVSKKKDRRERGNLEDMGNVFMQKCFQKEVRN